MTGTANQVEWAEQIRLRVAGEFDRVSNALQVAALRQTEQDQIETRILIGILGEKRAEVMANDRAGYFIHDWQELSDQVRQMIAKDVRYHAIQANRAARRQNVAAPQGPGPLNMKLENNELMNIRPLYDRIVVKRIEEKETTRNGIVIPDSAQEKPQEGEVMAAGKGKRLEDGKLVALDVKAGDRILFGKYSGNEIALDGTDYIVMREEDVLGVLTAAA